jgi:hypothetical protein
MENLLVTFFFFSALRPLAACDLLASLRWPCYAGFPGAFTRRCRVRLQRPREFIYIYTFIIIYTSIESWTYAEFYLIIDIGNPLEKKTCAKRIPLPFILDLIYRNNIILL